jgi:hypothetical protein
MSNAQLIKDTLQSLNEFLPRISETCLRIATDFRTDNETDALNNIKQLIEAFEWSIQAINGIKSLGYPLNIDTAEINDILHETEEALEALDLVLLADMFEYELHPCIENWLREILDHTGD